MLRLVGKRIVELYLFPRPDSSSDSEDDVCADDVCAWFEGTCTSHDGGRAVVTFDDREIRTFEARLLDDPDVNQPCWKVVRAFSLLLPQEAHIVAQNRIWQFQHGKIESIQGANRSMDRATGE